MLTIIETIEYVPKADKSIGRVAICAEKVVRKSENKGFLFLLKKLGIKSMQREDRKNN